MLDVTEGDEPDERLAVDVGVNDAATVAELLLVIVGVFDED